MKMRLCFVANSSSSSFVMMGVEIDTNIICDSVGISYDDCHDYDALYDYIRSIGLEYETDDYSDYIGLYLSDLGEDETLSNFRERVKSILIEKLGKYGKELSSKVSWIERCYWDGIGLNYETDDYFGYIGLYSV